MRFFALPFYYLYWHYTRGVFDLWNNYSNILDFIKNVFSFNILAETLFEPWERLHENYSFKNGMGDVFSSFIVNFLMRIVGFIIRFSTLLIGLLIYATIAVFGAIFCLFWFSIPAILIVLLFISITALALQIEL